MASKEIIITVKNGRDRSDAALAFTGAALGGKIMKMEPSAAGKPCDSGPGTPDKGTGTGVATKTRAKTKKPDMYKVIILDDDYTPMEFVTHVLERFFGKDHESAQELMMKVHTQGSAVAGVFTYEIAETKVNQVMEFARQHGHPLQLTTEKAGGDEPDGP